MADDRLRRRAPEALPLTLLTGFLGSGKTTLLNRLVEAPAFADAVVIVNEFGEVAIDHLLIEKADGGLLTLASGCICCSVRGDMVTTLEDLLRRRDNGRMPPFDRVVVETTGLADPAPILNAIALHPYLSLRYRVDGVLTTVDALHGLATLDAHAEAQTQVAVADGLIVTKSDLLADRPAMLEFLRGRLRTLNPLADMFDAALGEASAPALLGASLFRHAARLGTEHEPHDHHDHDHEHGEDAHHHAGIGSFVLRGDGPLAATGVEMFLDLVRATHGAALLRVKGLLAMSDDPARPLLVQGVQHTMHPPRRLAAWPDADHGSRLVVIGRDLDRTSIERLWAAFFAAPAIDTPDGAALASPFATSGPGLF